MLHADKDQLRAGAKVSLLGIQNLELEYHVDNCLNIGLQATIVAGLSYYGIMEIDDAQLKGEIVRLAYYLVTYVSMCLCLVSGFVATLSATRGPGYGLRGPEGSIHQALIGVAQDVKVAYFLFVAGLFLLFPSLVLFLYAVYPPTVATFNSIVMILMMALMAAILRHTKKVFHLDNDAKVTAHFEGADFAAATRPQPAQQEPRAAAADTAAVAAAATVKAQGLLRQADTLQIQRRQKGVGPKAALAPATVAASAADSMSPNSEQQEGDTGPPTPTRARTSSSMATFFEQHKHKKQQQQQQQNEEVPLSTRPSPTRSGPQEPHQPQPHQPQPPRFPPQPPPLPPRASPTATSPRSRPAPLLSSATAFLHAASRPNEPLGVAMEGYLYKLPSSGRSGSWQRRYVVVSGDAIRWYPSEEAWVAGKPKGALAFSPQTTAWLTEGRGEAEPRQITISEGRRRLTLKPPSQSEDDLDEWLQAVEEKVWPLRSLQVVSGDL